MVTITDKFIEFDEFKFDGHNARIQMNGEIETFYECYHCGNATEHMPRFCPKCYCINGIRLMGNRMFNSQAKMLDIKS